MSQTHLISTRQKILDAAVPEFWAHGFRGASVRAICARAGASSNSITYHFGSKEKLYQEILGRFTTLLLAQTKTALSGELRSQEAFEIRLEMFLTQLLESYHQNRETVLIATREFEQLLPGDDHSSIHELIEINHALADFIQKAKAGGFVCSSVDAEIVAGTLLDRLINQVRFSHAHKRFFDVTSKDQKYRAYWVRASLGLLLNGMKPRAESAPHSAKGENHAHRTHNRD